MKNRRRLSDRWNQWICFLMLVCFTTCLRPASCAAENETRETIRVGFFAFDGYHTIDEDGVRGGYGYELLRMISRYLNVDYEYVGYENSWDDMLDMLAAGEIDLVTSARITPERLDEFAFTKPIGKSSAMLTTASTNRKIISGQYDTYDGIRIGLLEGNSRNGDLKEFAEDADFSYESVYFEMHEDLEQALRSGQVDAIMTSSLRQTENERVLDYFAVEQFYAVLRKEDTDLLEKLNYAITQIDAVEGDWKNTLNNKYYFHEEERDLTFTQEEKELLESYLSGEKKLAVAACLDKKPYAYTEDGEAKGILFDYFTKLADYVGVPYTVVIPKDRAEYNQWCKEENVANVFLDGRFSNMQQAEELGKSVTAAYTTMGLAMVTRRDFSGKVGVLAVSTEQGLFGIEDGLAGDAEQLEVPSREDAMQTVLDGKADAAFAYIYSAQRFVNQDTRGLLTYTMLAEPTYDYHVVFASDVNSMMAGIFTKAIFAMQNGTFEDIAAQYTSYKAEDVDLLTWIKIHPVITIIVILAVFVICLLAVFLVQRQKVVTLEQKRSAQLEELARLAESANRAKTMFLNNMSHDIRTPMNAIIGFTSLAASHLDDPQRVKEYLQKISVSSEHLLSLINDVLDMSRIESGKVKIDEQPVHLPDLLHDIRTIVQPTVASKQLNFLIDTVDVRDENIIADKLRLNQILLNILSNGVKFNKVGGTLSLKIKQLPKAPAGCASYQFIVRDTGIGMKKEFAEQIFDAFSREETATVSGIPGTGLGMNITKNIVDMMGGTILVKSQENVGSEFTVTLTFRLSGEPVVYEKLEQLQGLRVLVADDDTDTCLNISNMLTDIGMRPEWTASGKEAVIRAKYAYETGDEFSAYIIDWLMPDMNGIETVRRIRRVIGDGKPIIILTAYDWADVEAEAREAGVTAFCAKPLFMSELRDVLSQPFRTAPPEKKKEVNFTGKKVLLVEDNQLNQEIAGTLLKEMGFQVETVDDGSAAVERMKHAMPNQYDLILMDIQMPFMDGYEATKRIRAMERPAAQIPIVAMTANAFSADREKAMACGMNGYLTKPISVKLMINVLNEVLEQEPSDRQRKVHI